MNSRDHQTPKLKRKKYLPLLHRYALQFNGTDECLTRALPVNLLTGTQNDFVSAGTRPASFSDSGATWNQTGILGSTSTNVLNLTAPAAFIMYTGLTVGKKYKLRVRWFGDSALRIGSTAAGADYATVAVTTQWNTVIRTFTALSTSIAFSMASGTGYIDFLNFTEDWKLDLNESWELIKHSNNRDFEGTDIAFTGTGNHSAARSTADKYAGSASLLISAGGPGHKDTDFVSLPATAFEPLVVGNKYTKEFWAKVDPASLTYGSDLIINGTDWTDDNSDGTPNLYEKTGVSDVSSIETGSGFTGNWVKYLWGGVSTYPALLTTTNKLTSGKLYKCTFSYIFDKGVNSNLSLCYGSLATITTITTNTVSTPTTVTLYFYANATDKIGFRITTPSTGSYFGVDNFKLYEATTPTLTAQIGTKSVAITPSISSFTKYVLNFEASASEVGQDIKFYLNGAGSVFIDNLSITQAYDRVFALGFKSNTDNTSKSLIYANSNEYVECRAGGVIRNNVSDGVVNVNNSLSSYTTSTWINFISLLNRTDKLYGYKNGVADSGVSVLLIGKYTNPNLSYRIGVNSGGTDLFNGNISPVQVVRFTNISQSNFNPNTYKPGYPVTGGGAEIVLWYDPKNGSSVANMLQDYSGNGNNLSAVNMDLTNRVIVRN